MIQYGQKGSETKVPASKVEACISKTVVGNANPFGTDERGHQGDHDSLLIALNPTGNTHGNIFMAKCMLSVLQVF